MSNRNSVPRVLILRSIGWPWVKQVDASFQGLDGKRKHVRRVVIMGGSPQETRDFREILSDLFRESRNSGVRDAVVDLTDVLEVFSVLLGFYLMMKQEIEKNGGRIALANPTKRVRALLAFTRMDTVFPIYDSVPDAVRALAASAEAATTEPQLATNKAACRAPGMRWVRATRFLRRNAR